MKKSAIKLLKGHKNEKKMEGGVKKFRRPRKSSNENLKIFCHLSQASQQEYQTQKHFFFFSRIKSHLVSSTPWFFFLCRFHSNLSLKFDHDRRSAVGTSCFGEVVILSSKAIKGVAGGGGAPPDSD